MARTPEPYHYTVETLARLSGWPPNRVHQDVSRNDLRLGDVEEAAVWLAANGTPELRARMAKRLIPVVLGTKERRPKDNAAVAGLVTYDVLKRVFEADAGKRKKRAKTISKGLQKGNR